MEYFVLLGAPSRCLDCPEQPSGPTCSHRGAERELRSRGGRARMHYAYMQMQVQCSASPQTEAPRWQDVLFGFVKSVGNCKRVLQLQPPKPRGTY